MLHIGFLTKLIISNTGQPVKKVEMIVDEEFTKECLCDSDGSFGFKFFAFDKLREFVLQAICRPFSSPGNVKLPLRQIVQRAKSFCENHLEDAAIFLSEVAVQSYDTSTLVCECVLWGGGDSINDITI